MKTFAPSAILGIACAFLIVPHGFSPPVNANVIETPHITCSSFASTTPVLLQNGLILGWGYGECSHNQWGQPIDWKVEVVVHSSFITSNYSATAQRWSSRSSIIFMFPDTEPCATGTWHTTVKVYVKLTSGGSWKQQAQAWSNGASINCTTVPEE